MTVFAFLPAARRRRAVMVTLALPAFAALVSAAHADVKVVTKMSGASASPFSAKGNGSGTMTTYYKGNKIRIENADGSRITLIDGDAGKQYVVTPAKKSYIVQPLSAPAGMMARASAMMDVTTSATVTPLNKTRTIAGKVAKGYAFTTNIAMSMKAGAFGNQGGAGKTAAKPQPIGGMKIVGEQWVSPQLILPISGAALGAYRRMTGGAIGEGMSGFKPILEKMATIKGFPLATRQTMTGTGMIGAFIGGAMQRGSGGAGPTPGAVPGTPPSVTITTETVSLSQAPLPASLFALPAGYTQQQAPTMMPGGMGGGRAPRPAGM